MEEQLLFENPTLHAGLTSYNSPFTVNGTDDSILTFSQPSLLPSPQRQDANSQVITKIEKVFESITDGLLHNNDELSISVKIKQSYAASGSLDGNSVEPTTETRKVNFPGRTANEAWRFSMACIIGIRNLLTRSTAVLFRILELIHEALISNVIVSKRYSISRFWRFSFHFETSFRGLIPVSFRNIYYKDPSLFKTQAVVDRCVDSLAYTFDVPRAKLNVVSASVSLHLVPSVTLTTQLF